MPLVERKKEFMLHHVRARAWLLSFFLPTNKAYPEMFRPEFA